MLNEIKSFEERKKELVKQGKAKGFITYEEFLNILNSFDVKYDIK